MSDVDVAAIREALAKATSAGWLVAGVVSGKPPGTAVVFANALALAETTNKADAELIVLLRNNAEALLDELALYKECWSQEKQRAEIAEERAENLEDALDTVVSTLGPDGLCDCSPGDETCGLRDEAYYALQVARKAIRSKEIV